MNKRIAQIFEDVNKAFPGSVSRLGITPSTSTGLLTRYPRMPLQGTNAIHEEDAAPTNDIQPLQLGNLSIEGYIATEQNKPSVIRYKVLKDGIPLPVNAENDKSSNVGHTKELVLKKLSMHDNKMTYINKFIKYNKDNELLLSKKQQEKVV